MQGNPETEFALLVQVHVPGQSWSYFLNRLKLFLLHIVTLKYLMMMATIMNCFIHRANILLGIPNKDDHCC